MKAKVIRRLRKKISSNDYYYKRADKLSEQLEYLDSFRVFKCNSFFVGDERATFNRIEYRSKYPRLSRKFNWYMDRLKGRN